MYFNEEQTTRLEEMTRQIEEKTGTEIVVTVIDKSDLYPEIPWKAFAMGTAMAALALLVYALVPVGAPHFPSIWAAMLIPMFTGAACACLTIFSPKAARLFLDATRAEGETAQYAKSVFLDHELFNTPDRCGLLVLISLFERRVTVLPDTGLSTKIADHALEPAVALITRYMLQGNAFKAIQEGLAALERILSQAGFSGEPGTPDRIASELIQQKGAGQ